VRFDHERQLPVEPGSDAWLKVREALRSRSSSLHLPYISPASPCQVREALRSRSSSACELRITVTAERGLELGGAQGGAEGGGGGARLLGALGAERRYVLGTARVGLAELLRGGTDLVEQPLPLLGRNWDLADGAGAPPTLLISLSAVAALAAVAASLPGVAPHGGALRPAAMLVAQRVRLAARLQAAARGWLVRQRLRRSNEPPPTRTLLSIAVLALSGAAHPPPPTRASSVPAGAAGAAGAVPPTRAASVQSGAPPTLLAQLAAELRFQLAIELGDLAPRSARDLGAPTRRAAAATDARTDDRTDDRNDASHGRALAAATPSAGAAPPPPPPPVASEWLSLPATAEAVAAVEGLSAGLDMRCGGRVRTELREALLHGQLSRGHVSLVLRGPSRTSTLALTLSLTSP